MKEKSVERSQMKQTAMHTNSYPDNETNQRKHITMLENRSYIKCD